MEQSPLQPTPVGALRFNTDSSKLEYYDGNQWVNVTSTSPEAQTGGTRGLFAGGRESAPAFTNKIEYINVDTTGNFIDFGNLTEASGNGTSQGGCGSRTRGMWLGGQGQSNPYLITIDYVTYSSLGDAADFGDISQAITQCANLSSATRALRYAGSNPSGTFITQIDAVNIANTGTLFDFGDVSNSIISPAVCMSPTRGITAGGTISPTRTNIIEYLTFSTQGNTADFGDLTEAKYAMVGASNAVRGVFHSGLNTSGNPTNSIDYITIASLGNAVDFGDILSVEQQHMGCASPTRAIFGAGFDVPAKTSVVEFVQIMSTGNAIDFGDCTGRDETRGACSNGHGGLG